MIGIDKPMFVSWDQSRGDPSVPTRDVSKSPTFLNCMSHLLSINAAMHSSLEYAGPSTLSLHADDPVNVVTDVAPPLHVATTFRYPDNPEDLVPVADAENVSH